ncbi:MAG: carboxypeptidase-like regulatory domain-containing protein [Chloroflexia bacterium]|nr:carboxypeptidase-like regulatory domain-containing protein [Chloroflexia bacterium]
MFFLITIVGHSQSGFIRGTVFDDNNGESLPGSTVAVDGTTLGTITDLDGNLILK